MYHIRKDLELERQVKEKRKKGRKSEKERKTEIMVKKGREGEREGERQNQNPNRRESESVILLCFPGSFGAPAQKRLSSLLLGCAHLRPRDTHTSIQDLLYSPYIWRLTHSHNTNDNIVLSRCIFFPHDEYCLLSLPHLSLSLSTSLSFVS